MAAATLMVQGTSSDAGKSTLVAGLCRLLARRGVRVVPFKPQNMALNSAVAVDGGEIGRAQAVQALAARVAPHSDMNPVLLKPASDVGAQIIIHGRPLQHMDAVAYHAYKPIAQKAVLESYARLRQNYEAVVVEGAGSPAEINLRDRDIANMGFAEAVDCPVILIADIDRGGVFAQLVGTLALLSPSEQARIQGFVINRFRGDLALLQPGLDWLATYTGKPVLGVLPYLQQFYLDAEDAIDARQESGAADRLKVVVPVLPRISNHTDFDALRLHPQVELEFVAGRRGASRCDLIILPGSKNVRADLAWLRAHGWEETLRQHLRYGGKVMGICGGYQMLGRSISDPAGLEGPAGDSAGLGWLPLTTELRAEKILRRVCGRLRLAGGDAPVEAYEIHHGISQVEGDRAAPLLLDGDRPDGCVSDDGQILGTYLHGLFDHPAACDALLNWASGALNWAGGAFTYAGGAAVAMADVREAAIDRLADTLEAQLDLAALDRILERAWLRSAESAT